GRGAAKSSCILVAPIRPTDEARARLDVMVRTANGFEIAEADLEIRGPGEFFGTRQSGDIGFHVAHPFRDREFLELARREALALVEPQVQGQAAATAPSTARPSASAQTSALDRILRSLPLHWQRRYHLARIA